MLRTFIVTIAAIIAAVCSQRIITIDGGWSPWSTVSTPCMRADASGVPVVVTCGGGLMLQRRSCTNPTPQGIRAKYCEGALTTNVTCNTNPCDMQWSPWSNCSAICGRGMRRRYTMCAPAANATLVSCKDLGLSSQDFYHIQDCNTWNIASCPSPCLGYKCQEYASCVDISNNTDPGTQCVCQLGRITSTNTDGVDICIVPPPTTPTPRPIPTLQPVVKAVTTAVTMSACVVLIIFIALTLFLFAWLKIYDHARIIQMNMEISLLLAHICILIPALTDYPVLCKIQSILIHYFLTTCFTFMFLESLHVYSIVAFVVKKNGILTKGQNVLIGWGVPTGTILIVIAFCYEDYGGVYLCWIQMDTTLLFGQVGPIAILVALTFTLIEAAGAADYRRLPGTDQAQLFSAKINQRTILIIMPLVFVSYILGALAEYEQNAGMYGTVTVINSILGASIFFFHSTGNEQVREKLSACQSVIFKQV